MLRVAEELVSKTMSSLDRSNIPKALHDCVDRHRSHLLNLATALLDGGQNESTIERVVDRVFSSYKQELVQTIMALRDDSNGR